MIQVDIALTATIVTLVAAILSGVGAFINVFRKFDPLPEAVKELETRVSVVEDTVKELERIDLDRLQKSLDAIEDHNANDYRAIKQINLTQNIIMQALCAMMEHMETGNHVEQLSHIKTQMIMSMSELKGDGYND